MEGGPNTGGLCNPSLCALGGIGTLEGVGGTLTPGLDVAENGGPDADAEADI
ncbi:hypothetical protein C0993_001912, partial [Termitomyces sp. T159_Od127]